MDKSEFKNYRTLVREVKQLHGQLRALESSLYSPKGQQFSTMPRAASGPKKTMDDAVAGHLKLEALYQEKLAAQEAQQLIIEQAISSLEEPAERVVMRARYIEGRSWLDIVRDMQKQGYSERSVYRLHGYALAKLREV